MCIECWPLKPFRHPLLNQRPCREPFPMCWAALHFRFPLLRYQVVFIVFPLRCGCRGYGFVFVCCKVSSLCMQGLIHAMMTLIGQPPWGIINHENMWVAIAPLKRRYHGDTIISDSQQCCVNHSRFPYPRIDRYLAWIRSGWMGSYWMG